MIYLIIAEKEGQGKTVIDRANSQKERDNLLKDYSFSYGDRFKLSWALGN